MNRDAAQRLLDLNRRFYEARGRDFSETRLRLQPGVKRLIETLRGNESILDLGCGNGALARSLSRRGQRGPYLGLDFSPVLLAETGASSLGFPAHFILAELSQPSWDGLVADGHPPFKPPFDIILCFAVLHHIPGAALRADILCKAHDLLAATGRLMLSNWRFTEGPRMSRRIQSWSAIDMTPEVVDANDYLLDWRRGGVSLRYVHEFDESELAGLAASSGFDVSETFYSDGADRHSSLYQVWSKSRG